MPEDEGKDAGGAERERNLVGLLQICGKEEVEAAPEHSMGMRARADVTKDPSVYVGGEGSWGKAGRHSSRKGVRRKSWEVGRISQGSDRTGRKENLSSSSLLFHGIL